MDDDELMEAREREMHEKARAEAERPMKEASDLVAALRAALFDDDWCSGLVSFSYQREELSLVLSESGVSRLLQLIRPEESSYYISSVQRRADTEERNAPLQEIVRLLREIKEGQDADRAASLTRLRRETSRKVPPGRGAQK